MDLKNIIQTALDYFSYFVIAGMLFAVLLTIFDYIKWR
jgi:hypothetical protein